MKKDILIDGTIAIIIFAALCCFILNTEAEKNRESKFQNCLSQNDLSIECNL
jgi:hypothetical protein